MSISYFQRDDSRIIPAGVIVIGVVLVLGVTATAALFGFLLYGLRAKDLQASQVQAVLEKEFRAISHLPAATPVGYNTTQNLVSHHYRTDHSYAEIRKHYDEELLRHGWIFYQEDKVRDWGRDLGGKTAHYCKGEYRVSLQYAGKSADYGWDYTLGLGWGLDAILQKYPEEFKNAGCRLAS